MSVQRSTRTHAFLRARVLSQALVLERETTVQKGRNKINQPTGRWRDRTNDDEKHSCCSSSKNLFTFLESSSDTQKLPNWETCRSQKYYLRMTLSNYCHWQRTSGFLLSEFARSQEDDQDGLSTPLESTLCSVQLKGSPETICFRYAKVHIRSFTEYTKNPRNCGSMVYSILGHAGSLSSIVSP